MTMKDVWSGLANQLANLIEKYAGMLALDTLPDPVRPKGKLAEKKTDQKIHQKNIVIERAA